MIAPRLSIRTAAIALGGLVTVALFAAWRADRRDRAQLAADLATAKQALTQADARQHQRDAQLQQALAAIATQKRTVTTPVQIIRALPKAIPLPRPITLERATPTDQAQKGHPVAHASEREALDSTPSSQSTSREPSSQVVLPADDLKPIYDFALDCQACRAKLAAAQGDLSDERAKSATLAKERDEAVRVAKGGSGLRRLARATKWFLIGAAAGLIASHAAH
jgi:hypothetical protein